MAILHGSWLLQSQLSSPPGAEASGSGSSADLRGAYFFLWGETWRRIDPIEITAGAIPLHPFGMNLEELLVFLHPLQQAQQLQWQVSDVPLEVAATSGRTPKRGRGQTVTAALPLPPHRWRSHALALPTYQQAVSDAEINSGDNGESGAIAAIPQHSAAAVLERSDQELTTAPLTLQYWHVQGICLTPLEAIRLLQSLPLGSVNAEDAWMGSDLRFWSHLARWSLDLLARSKFLPRLERHHGTAVTYWQTLLDSAADQSRLEQFAYGMPAACRTYQGMDGLPAASPGTQLFPQARTILLSFLHSITDAQVRAAIATQVLPTQPFPKDLPLREWLQALGTETAANGEPPGQWVAEPERLERLDKGLNQWIAPLQHQLEQRFAAFRTCFYLQPPGPGQAHWTLEYFLQAAYDASLIVSARVIWDNPVEQLVYQGHTIDHPQETLLAGLGLASRLYPLLEPSLQVQRPQFCQLDPLQVYEFIKATAWRLQDSGFGVILPPSLSQQEGWANRLGLRVRAEATTGPKQRLGLQSLLSFKWELTIGGQRLSKAEFDRLVAQNTPLVEVNGEWVELRPQDVKAAQSFFTSRKDQMALSLEDAFRISTGDTQMIEKLPVVEFEASGALQELINTLTTGNQNVEAIATPEAFQGELRPYQLRGASWLAFLERWGLGACLADDMGLGKTIQTIAFLLHLKEQGSLQKPTLLVCPTSVLGNWEREVRKFGQTLKTLVHHGDKRAKGKAFAKAIQDQHIIITSYSLVHRDAKDLQAIAWQGVVLDEAQNVKNPDAKQSQAVRELDTEFRIALTGTPIENRLSELWSIMDFLNPGYLGPRNFFQRRFAIPIERYGDTASLHTLRSLVQPFLLRRLKTDRNIIQDLPEKQEMAVFCGLSAEQAALYQKLVDQSLIAIESAEGIQRRGMILALLVKLKQVCNHPALFKPGSNPINAPNEPKDEPGDEPKPESKGESKTAKTDLAIAQQPSFRNLSGKLQRLEEMLEEVLLEGDRCLIFTQFAEWGKLLQTYLAKKFDREVLFLYGSTSKKQREEMVDRFQNDPQGPRIFILSLKAGGVGLNLTRANHVFHFDRWWNPAVENQATDRVFRIGQTQNVQVHKFVCTGTLEERIHDLIESKKALSEQVVGAGENWLTEFDTDQLRNLLLLDRSAVINDEEG